MSIAGHIANLLGTGARYAASMADDLPKPETPSGDWQAMVATWCKIDDILAGADRIRSTGGGSGSVAGPHVPRANLRDLRRGGGGENKYLPKYPEESAEEYSRRLAAAPWRREFADTLASLTSKPFSKPVMLQGEPSDKMKAVADDIDGRGNNLHVFARGLFNGAVAKGLGAVMVDFPRVGNLVNGRPRTLADDRRDSNRPYWVYIPAENILAAYSQMRGGKEYLTHIRIRECSTERAGFEERIVERVRVIELNAAGRVEWTLYEKQESGAYLPIANDTLQMGTATGIIPIAMLFTGERFGNHGVRAPLGDLADMQIELFRSLSREDEILTYAGSPMLSAYGMAKGEGDGAVRVGPKTILYAPPSEGSRGSGWEYISPDAQTIAEVGKNVVRTTEDFRRLAMQPQTPKSGGITATSSAIDASKAHSQAQEWALALKDCLDRCLQFTSMWLGTADNVTVNVHTDFAGDASGVEEAKVLADAQKRDVISKKTEQRELQRRNILGPDYDPDADELQIASEREGLAPEEPIDPTNGDIIPFSRAAQ
jgi:hypothetical protein